MKRYSYLSTGPKCPVNAMEPAKELAKQVGEEIIFFHVVPDATVYTAKEV